MHHVIHDSDEEDDLELVNSDNDGDGTLTDASRDSPDELGGPPGTSSTDKLLKEAHARMMQGDSPRSTSTKRKRGEADNTTRMGQEQSVWDVPGSPPRRKIDDASAADAQAQRLTSSDIRRKYEGTPTEAATSSTSNPEKHVVDLSKSTLDSGVSFDGPGPGSKLDIDVRGRTSTSVQGTTHEPMVHDGPIVLVPRRQRHSDSEQSSESPSNPRTTKHRRGTESNDQSKDQPGELLDSDELEIGLPKERYRPRPSRRRTTAQAAGRDGSDEIALAQNSRSRKRRKTEGPDDAAISDGVAHLVDMGFSPAKARECIRKVIGNVEDAMEMLLQGSYNAEDHGDELATTTEADTKDTLVSNHDVQPIEAGGICSGTTSPAKTPRSAKSKGSAAKKKRGRPKKEKPLESSELAQYTDSQIHGEGMLEDVGPVSDAGLQAQEEVSPAKRKSPSKPKGRGRGRPRKSGQSTNESETVAEEVEEKASTNADEAKSTSDGQQVAIDSHAGRTAELAPCPETKASQDDDKENMLQSKVRQELGTTDKKSASSPATTKMAKVEPGSDPSKGTSRVPHRVGLSKRVRMPSLLRVVRKP